MKCIALSFLFAVCITHIQAYTSYYDFRSTIIRNLKCTDIEDVPMSAIHSFFLDGKLEEAERNPQLKCFEACLLEQSGVMENCNMSDDNLANFEMLEEFHGALVTCKGSMTASERCECAYQLSRCINEQLPYREAS